MGRLLIVGIGPGCPEHITPAARAALDQAQVLCGYTGYLRLIRDWYPDKEMLATPMTQELQRCRAALELASGGKTVAMVCSGDAGIYGMAGPILQLAAEFPGVEIQVVPGITAAVSGAAVLGAPLMNDFAVISLSDLLTPWETIARRLEYAARGGFSIVLYNPGSRTRTDRLTRACDILLQWRSGETVCALVRSIGRDGQTARLLTLAQLQEETVDMFTTVFIGSSQTRALDGKMVTPRGYEAKL